MAVEGEGREGEGREGKGQKKTATGGQVPPVAVGLGRVSRPEPRQEAPGHRRGGAPTTR